MNIAQAIIEDVCELEYDSPEDQPELLTCTVGELTAILETHFTQLQAELDAERAKCAVMQEAMRTKYGFEITDSDSAATEILNDRERLIALLHILRSGQVYSGGITVSLSEFLERFRRYSQRDILEEFRSVIDAAIAKEKP